MTVFNVKQQLNQSQQRLHAVSQGIGQAIDWVDGARHGAPRLDIEADRLKTELRRGRTHAQHLSDSLAGANTLALYGLSQQGKAWLMNHMVADASGRLESHLAGKTLDYFQHINPGNQDCGFATRFSHQAEAIDSRWPVELRLLSEADITCIIATLWLQTEPTYPDEQQIRARLQGLMSHRQPEAVAGITGDETLEVWDYLRRHDAERQQALQRYFWPAAIELAPMLTIDDRARLFSLLWQEKSELTNLWRQLAHRRSSIGAQRVMAPLSLLVDDALLPADALLAPAAVAVLNTGHDKVVQVCPRDGDRSAAALSISLAELALLTAEMRLPLSSTPRVALFEQTDVLDIPGFGDPVDALSRQQWQRVQQQHPLVARLLRAKRGYLLDSYSVRQQIERLMVCSAAGEREEIKPVSQQLDFWRKQTMGIHSDAHKGQKPALIWTVTPFDQRYFQQKNVDEAVQRQVGTPGEAWGSMLAQDVGSIQRMADWLTAEMRPEVKLQRINARLQALQRHVAHHLLASWQRDDAVDERQQKQQISEALLKALQSRTGLHGELLERLQPSREMLRQLYLSMSRSSPPQAGVFPQLSDMDIEIDLFGEAPVPRITDRCSHLAADDERQFAELVERYWINFLRDLPQQHALLTLLGISNMTLESLVEELIIAFYRLNIGASLRSRLTENQPGYASSDAKIDRQVSRALTVLGDFVSWLGFLEQSEEMRPDSRINRGHKIFAPSPTAMHGEGGFQRLTRLSAVPASSTAGYIYDWLVGLNSLIIRNGGHAAALALDGATRERLARIVQQITV